MAKVKIEICCDHLESAINASKYDIDRIELCAALDLGGITPDIDTYLQLQDLTDIPIAVLIRPRPGNFNYSSIELSLILSQIDRFVKAGAHGIVVGTLNNNTELNTDFLREISNYQNATELVFHRAFDFIENPSESLEIIINHGFKRILTSGKQITAWDGRLLIKHLIDKANNRICIMPGAGIDSKNLKEIIQYTGAKEIHLSAKTKVESSIKKPPFEIDFWSTDSNEIDRVIQIANNL